ncbi:MAG: hypothetical protein JNK24_05230 [Alphaproteobacteria bacterium]|nr:hypothetical protein [Alphaproteobacteria bacterium]
MARIIGQGMKKKLRQLESLRSAFAMVSGVLDYFYPRDEMWDNFTKRFIIAPIFVGAIATASYYVYTAHKDIDPGITPGNTLMVQAGIPGKIPRKYTIIIKDGATVGNAGNKVSVYEETKQGEFRLVDNSLTASQIVHLLRDDVQNHPEHLQGVTGGLSPAIDDIKSTLREFKDPMEFALDKEAIDRMAHMLSKAQAIIKAEGYQPRDETGRYSLTKVFCNLTLGSMFLCLASVIFSFLLKGRLERRIEELEGRMAEMRKTRPAAHWGFGGGPQVSPLFRVGTDPLLKEMDPKGLVFRLAPSNVSVFHPPQQP